MKANYTFRTSGEGVEEALIVQFGIKWMKATTDALQDKKEEDEDPSQVTNLFLKSDSRCSIALFKGIVHQFFFYCSNLIFWIVMGCGIADFGRRGL